MSFVVLPSLPPSLPTYLPTSLLPYLPPYLPPFLSPYLPSLPSIHPSIHSSIHLSKTNGSILLILLVNKYNKQQNKQTNASEEVESNGVVQPKADIFFTSCKPRLGRRNQMELEYLFHNRTYS